MTDKEKKELLQKLLEEKRKNQKTLKLKKEVKNANRRVFNNK